MRNNKINLDEITSSRTEAEARITRKNGGERKTSAVSGGKKKGHSLVNLLKSFIWAIFLAGSVYIAYLLFSETGTAEIYQESFAVIGKAVSIISISVLSIIVLFLASWFVVQGKNANEVLKIASERIKEKYEGKQLNIKDQFHALLGVTTIVIKHKAVRFAIVIILITFAIVWIVFELLPAILLLILIFLLVAYKIAKYIMKNIKTIEADPPHVGLVKFMNQRLNIVLKEGYAITIPGVLDFIPINVTKINQDFKSIEKVFSADNILVHLTGVSLVYSPDIERLTDFINIGGREGVEDATEDIIPDDLRIWARTFPTDGLLDAKRDAVQKIITDLTGESEITPEKLRNGIPDAHLLGIKVFRFTIGAVEPSEEYVKDVEKKRREEIQRDYEVFETGTEIEQAQLLQARFRETGEEVSLEKCLRLIKDYKIQREGRPVVPGLSDLLSSGTSFADVFKVLFRGEKK